MCILEALSYLAIIIASITAIFGINSWRREFKGKRQIELAEDVLALFYEAVDAIHIIRSPFGYKGEGSSRKTEENETAKQKIAREQVGVIQERYQKQKEPFNKLHSMRYRFMAQFGNEAAKPFDDIRNIIHEIFSAANSLAWIWEHGETYFGQSSQLEERIKETRKYEKIIWDRISKDDPINPRLDQIIKDIDDICEPTLSYKIDFKIKFITSLFERLKRKGK